MLVLCDSAEKKRLDYVEDYQDLYTRSETFDIEVFQISSIGLFMATANRQSRPGSGIYKWVDGKFELYQNISTFEARAWKYFTIDNKVCVPVRRGPILSLCVYCLVGLVTQPPGW